MAQHELISPADCLAIIPARYASTRFPGKPLARLGNKAVLQHVYDAAAEVFPQVVVATDDARILQFCNDNGLACRLTSATCTNGTQRCIEIVQAYDGKCHYVVNIQGDEPLVTPSHLQALLSGLADGKADISTLVCPFPTTASREEIASPNAVKVVTDNAGNALYFSRSIIPFVRDTDLLAHHHIHPFLKHIGLYAFTVASLQRIAQLGPTSLEQAENLEQLRWLQSGLRLRTVAVSQPTIDINTPADLQRAALFLSNRNNN